MIPCSVSLVSYSLWSLLWFGSLRYTPAYYEDESLNDRD